MASLDWSHAQLSRVSPTSAAWVFKGTRTPVSVVFENLEDMTVDELVAKFGVTRDQIHAVPQFAAPSQRRVRAVGSS